MMDLGGPKIRTGAVLAPHHKKRVFTGDRIILSQREPEPAIAAEIDKSVEYFQTSCTIPSLLNLLTIDTSAYEEILWICEAAHIPVIWATQVLENLVKDGIPSRGEMSDVAMSERAECVMFK